MTPPNLSVKYLVVGAGPAGLGLATFFGSLGLEGVVISKAPCTADTPRAHTFNPFGFECLRDIGIEQAALSTSIIGDELQSMRWCRSMAEEEYGRVRGWAEHPLCKGALMGLTPCQFAEFPQSQMEPLLLKYASQHKFNVRFSSELVSMKEVADSQEGQSPQFHCTVRDLLSQQVFEIRTTYVFGADGAQSYVARSLGIPFHSKPNGGKACNILLRADLSHLMHRERHGGLHWILKPDRKTFFGMVAHLRMVSPWNEWVLVGFGSHGENPFGNMTPQSPELVDCVRELIGDDSVDIEILRMDPWTVRESVADRFDQPGSNVFLLGDAAHRHPPAFGLGSNTCVQDAYNLAWKVAYVANGLAGTSLLKSYSAERQPVGAKLVNATNQGLRAHAAVWESVGMSAKTRAEGAELLLQLTAPTEVGAAARVKLSNALNSIGYENQSLGICYNQWYDGSGAVYTDDEPGPRPPLETDPIVEPQVTTYPGSRLPHAWVDVPTRRKKISTQDLAGKGAFCLLVGEGGSPWRAAAATVAEASGVPIKVYGIGFGLEYIDINRDWQARRGVGENGCVLVRPDRFVAWRSPGLVSDCQWKLGHVLDQILHRNEL